MTEEQFLKTTFKPYMRIDWRHSRMNEPEECLLIGVDFNGRLLILESLPTEPDEEPTEFPARCEHCEITRPKPKLMKVDD